MSLFDFSPSKNREHLPPFGVRYLEHVLAEYATLSPAAIAGLPSKVESILNRATASPPDGMTWGDLFVLEKTLLAVQPEVTVRRRAWTIRDGYRELVGQQQYAVYTASKPPNEAEAAIDDVRADLDRLLDSLHWSYALTPILQRLRNGIIRFVGNCVLWGAVGLLLLAWRSLIQDQTLIATLLVLMVAGSVGGFVSLQQRIQNTPSGDPLLAIFELENGKFSLYLAPVSGAIFAVLLYFIFLGNLLSGVIFPENLTPFHFYWGVQKTAWGVVPGANPVAFVDYAKLVVWSFIAGFAERFVPDTLDRLVNRAQAAQGPAPPAPPPPPPAQGVPGPSSPPDDGDLPS
jgi:hypothetical protein